MANDGGLNQPPSASVTNDTVTCGLAYRVQPGAPKGARVVAGGVACGLKMVFQYHLEIAHDAARNHFRTLRRTLGNPLKSVGIPKGFVAFPRVRQIRP